ncbi:MAG: hypothetical protein GKS00_06895 [Alphaproteobacteria bacterium]|nr:hypothetical protein [Alphaproteobacteria bacterium]
MPNLLRLALTLDIAAIWCEYVIPITNAVLPIGGNHFFQVASFVLIAAILIELREILDRSK